MNLPEWIPAVTRQLVERSLAEMREGLADQLESVLLVGSAMNPAREDRVLSPDVLVIVAPELLADLGRAAEVLRRSFGRGLRVRLLSRIELERSVDVFTLEIADWKARHVLVHGPDPLTAITWTSAQLRHALELELRALSRRMRNRVVAGLASQGQRDNPRQAVFDGINTAVLCSRVALDLAGTAAPIDERVLLEQVGAMLKMEVKPLLESLALVRTGDRAFDPIAVCARLLAVVDPLTTWVDAWEASS